MYGLINIMDNNNIYMGHKERMLSQTEYTKIDDGETANDNKIQGFADIIAKMFMALIITSITLLNISCCDPVTKSLVCLFLFLKEALMY